MSAKCPCGLNLNIWQNSWNHWPGCSMQPAAVPDPSFRDKLAEALRTHHPIMRSETGPFSGCRCGQVKLGQDVIAHVVAHLEAAADQRAAEVLRAAADAIEVIADDDVTFELQRRAAALDPRTDG